VLLIVLGAAVAGLLALRIDDRVPVLVARHQISTGQRITAADLSVARLAAEGVATIPADEVDQVVGRYARQEIAPGRLVDTGMLNTSGLLTDGQAAVGIALQTGRFPAGGLETGDIVQVVRSVDGDAKVIATQAVVGSVRDPSAGAFGSNGNNTTAVTVIVSDRLSPAVAAAAMADQVSLVLLRRGDPAGGG
jgi:Flp pilus assembly protein CpaB